MAEKNFVEDVTLCITMGGRPDLLKKSLLSISEFYEFPCVIAINDFLDKDCDKVFMEIFPKGILISDGVKRGHHGAINKLYEQVNTKFVFHTEDDWVFNTPIDFNKIKLFLEQRPDITSYCFRDIFSFLKEDEVNKIKKSSAVGLDFFDLSKVHDEWYFYTFNPHVIFSKNIRIAGDFKNYKKERHISRFFKTKEMFVAYADPGICEHIGEGVSVANPNANKKKSKLRVWIRKKINALKSVFHSKS